MDRLWSPWRSAHVSKWHKTGESERDTVFVRIAESDDDEANGVIFRGTTCFVVMNRFPYNNGHLLVVPYRRVTEYLDLTGSEQHEIADLTASCMRWLRRAVRPEGFNVGMNIGPGAGAGIPGHLHMHVVPRWSGDTGFMSTTADLRGIPQAMETTFRALREAVQAGGS